MRDEFRTLINRLARVSYHHKHVCASKSIQNARQRPADAGRAPNIDESAGARHTSTRFAVHDAADDAGGPKFVVGLKLVNRQHITHQTLCRQYYTHTSRIAQIIVEKRQCITACSTEARDMTVRLRAPPHQWHEQ
eukprot:6172291-Pleurochrysis_carterae.AAC.3